MTTRSATTILTAATMLLLGAGMVGCSAESASADPTAASPAASSGTPSAPAESPTPATPPAPEETAEPTPQPTPVALPTDCRAILSAAVLDELSKIPLNNEVFGDSGVQDDGSLRCIWADPRADTSGITTDISSMPRGAAITQLNTLRDAEGFTCYEVGDGTRCEKTWKNKTYGVTDGRTLFWQQDVMIDTRYSNLAPSGYTDSIVAHLFS